MWILPETERLPSPHVSRRVDTIPVDTLILHYAVDGDQTPDDDLSRPRASTSFLKRKASDDCMDVARGFARPARNASAHFVIGRDGSKVQCAPLDKTAWHAGDGTFLTQSRVPRLVNRRSIGIEICNAGWAAVKMGISSYWRAMLKHPHNHKVQTWERYRPVQYETLDYLVALLVMAVPTLDKVVGHEDVTNRHTLGKRGGKLDPGPAFDYSVIDWEGYGITPYRFSFVHKTWEKR